MGAVTLTVTTVRTTAASNTEAINAKVMTAGSTAALTLGVTATRTVVTAATAEATFLTVTA